MLPNYRLARHLCSSTPLVYWRASEASETVLGVDNAKSGICYMYIWMYGWYVCPLNARAGNFILKLQSVRKFLRKRLLFKKQKVDSTGYYGIEDPFPDLISKILRFRGYGVLIVGCQESLVVRKP